MGRKAKHRSGVHDRPRKLPYALHAANSSAPEGTLQGRMGLIDNPTFFKTCISVMQKLAEKYLVRSCAVRAQPGVRWEKFINKLITAIPSMEDYEDVWPAKAYVAFWHHNYGTKIRSSVGRAKCGDTAQAPSISSVGPAVPAPSTAQPLPSSSQSESHTAIVSPTVSSANKPRTINDLQPVLLFLRSLPQPLEHLLPALFRLGVRDLEALHGLARMPHRREWMDRVIGHKLMPLQWKHLQDGLDALELTLAHQRS
ncbi:hypothetical protein BD414DRAFT_575165 [Trametes punicea]|nr:hypothetical protein BD414DRAFT_575165 [Trametes punicea]